MAQHIYDVPFNFFVLCRYPSQKCTIIPTNGEYMLCFRIAFSIHARKQQNNDNEQNEQKQHQANMTNQKNTDRTATIQSLTICAL